MNRKVIAALVSGLTAGACTPPQPIVQSPVEIERWEAGRPILKDYVSWRTRSEALAEARRTGKPLYLYYFSPRCGFCDAVQIAIYSEKRSAAVVNQYFIPVRIEDRRFLRLENDGDVSAEILRYEIPSVPTVVVVDGNGRVIEALRGWGGLRHFHSWLLKAASKANRHR